MGRKAVIYDEPEILRLYEKYGSIEDIRMRLGISPANVKKILEKNGIVIVKGVHNKKQLHYGRNIYK